LRQASTHSDHEGGGNIIPKTIVGSFADGNAQSNLSPYSGLQFFGEVRIDGHARLTVDLRDLDGRSLFSKTLDPEPGWQRR
jgi:alkaline phosphatase D